MAKLSNTPRQTLSFNLERRKSFTFRCLLLDELRNPINLAGCTLRFVVKPSEFDDDVFDTTNMVVNTTAAIDSPESGTAVFSFQAAELDGDPGDYYYSIVLWTADGFSVVIVKGLFTLEPNTESLSVFQTYTTGTSGAALELTLRSNDVVNIVTGSLAGGGGGSANIIGTGRPDNAATLEAAVIAQVAGARIGTEFISLDGAGASMWVWRKRPSGDWALTEQG